MRFVTVLISIILLISSIVAQEYHPLLEDGKYWTVEALDDVVLPPVSSQTTYYYQGDTTLSGTGYSIYGNNVYLREDITAKKVFIHDVSYPGNECLVYDFSLLVGETLENCHFNVPIESLDQFELNNGELRNRFSYTTNGDEFYIEGIGSRDGFVMLSDPIGPPNYELMCVTKNGIELYGARCDQVDGIQELGLKESLINIYPNPIQAFFQLESEYEYESFELFDSKGSLVKTFNGNVRVFEVQNLTSGLYFLRLISKQGFITKELSIE